MCASNSHKFIFSKNNAVSCLILIVLNICIFDVVHLSLNFHIMKTCVMWSRYISEYIYLNLNKIILFYYTKLVLHKLLDYLIFWDAYNLPQSQHTLKPIVICKAY